MSQKRDSIAYFECTRDPIFLFQRRRWALIELPDGCVLDEDGAGVYPGRDCEPIEGAARLTVDELLSHEAAVAWWETESVYLTREEGEAYGRARAYNYPDGWRVFCVCAEGALAKLLKEHA